MGVHRGCSLSMLLYINTAIKYIAIFIDANTWIKGVQLGDDEMKILNCPDDTTIFLLRDIIKSHEIASSSKTNFSKIQAL